MLPIQRSVARAGVMFFAGLCATAQTVTTNGGTANAVPKFSGPTTVVNSAVTENSGQVGIGTTNPQATLHVSGNNAPGVLVEAQDSFRLGTTVCCGAGPTGSSIGSNAGFSSFYNGMYLNSNGTAAGGSGGAQINTAVPSWRMALGSGTNEWPGGDDFVIARVPAGGNYAAPSILLKVDANGNLHSAGGIVFPDGSTQTTALPAPFAVCTSNSPNGASCHCPNKTLYSQAVQGGASCTTSGSTNSCSATSQVGAPGACCVCQ